MSDQTIPAWLAREEAYTPPSDRDAFLERSRKALLSALSKIKLQHGRDSRWSACPSLKLFSAVLLILLTACAKNLMFVWFMIAGVLVRLALLDGRRLWHILATSLRAAAFSAFLMLPAALLGRPYSLFTVTARVFVSVTLIGFLSHGTQWNRITGALKTFFVPDLFIFTLDITLKYIVLLGEVCLGVLESVRLRSVGRNRKKSGAVAGTMGVTFLKSREMSEELYGAMCCRGFTGEYRRARRSAWRGVDWAYCAAILLVGALFFYLERAIA